MDCRNVVCGEGKTCFVVKSAILRTELPSLPSPLAIGKNARNVDGARTFIDFILSPEGQQILVDRHFMPVRSDVEPPPGLPAGEIVTLPLDSEWLAEQGPQLRERFANLY